MASTITPNMSLIIPGVGTEQSPTYAFDINNSLTLIDQHDHSTGRGVQITPAGININTDLSLNSNSLTDALSIVFTASTSASTTPQSLSVAPGGESPQQQDLWYTPDTGVPIQITKNGQVNVVASSIDGETYASGTFFWTQAQDALPTTPANFDIGSVTIRPNVALTAFGVVLSPSSSISSQYNIQLPLLPVSQKIMTLDASGNMTAPYDVDNSTIDINSNNLRVKPGGITTTQINASANILGTQLSPTANILQSQLDATAFEYTVDTITPVIATFTVRAATTVNGTLSTAFDNGSVIDGVTLATNDIILVKNQTNSPDNGVYIVQASGNPVRHSSYDTFSELNYAAVTVTSGTVNAGTSWFQNNILTSLTDAQSWSTSSTQAYTVPAGVNAAKIVYVGGGGGGGGGAGSQTSGGGTGGGGGGGGSTPHSSMVSLTPGAIISITIGIGGAAGIAGNNLNTSVGGTGGNGGDTKVIGTGISLLALGASGGTGGDGPGAGRGGGPGGTSYVNTTNFAGFAVGTGGNGGAGSTGTATAGSSSGISYMASVSASGGAAGIGNSSGGGGGGGGPGLEIGGGGGAGGSNTGSINASAGSNAANYGGGGGGGGGARNSQGVGVVGGAGKSGVVYIYYQKGG